MAPFHTHFLIAEEIWPALAEDGFADHFGQFCFGNVAPDVDKVSTALSQRDTHFYDRYDDYELMATARTSTLIACRDTFFRAPFADLSPAEQAFALGYLCHLAVDEVTKHMWNPSFLERLSEKGTHIILLYSALDAQVQTKTENRQAIIDAVCTVKPLAVLPHVPLDDLAFMQQVVCEFSQITDVEAAFATLTKMMTRNHPERADFWLKLFAEQFPEAEKHVGLLELDLFLQRALAHTRRRLADFRAGRVPVAEPPY